MRLNREGMLVVTVLAGIVLAVIVVTVVGPLLAAFSGLY